jgi:hypothetical protein
VAAAGGRKKVGGVNNFPLVNSMSFQAVVIVWMAVPENLIFILPVPAECFTFV